MKKILMIFAAVLALAAPARAQMPVCTVTDTLYRNIGQVWPYGWVKVIKATKAGYVIGLKDTTVTADANGRIEFTVPRASTVVLYSPAVGLSEKGLAGVALTIPDAAAADLSTLVPSTSVPAQHVVAIPLLTVTDGAQSKSSGTLVIGPGLALDTSGTPTISAPASSTVNYGDSIRVADSLARYAVQQAALALTRADSVRNAVIANIESDIAELNGRLDTAGTYDRVYLYGQIAQLYDSLGTLLALINTKLSADTAALTLLLDAVYARSGGTPVDTMELVSKTRNETIYGNKDFDGTITGDNAVFDRDSTQSFGKLIHGQTKRDTLAQVTLKNDTLYVLPGELKEPTRLANATYSVGYQDFTVYMWRNNANLAHLWGGLRIVADSANGFELGGVDYDNYALFGAAPSLGSSRVIGQIYNNSATGWVWAAGNTNYGARPVTISPLNASSTRARIYLNFNAGGNNQMNYSEFRVRVHFYSASPATSSYYVKIEPQQ